LPGLRRSAWIEIDVAAVEGNLAAIADMSGGLPVMPVVKADAYGHGMVPIARILERAGVAALCVATLDEAVVLREAGIRSELLVLYPIPPGDVAVATRHAVAISTGARGSTRQLLAAASAAGVAGDLRIELEVETGLGRGGAGLDEVADVGRSIHAAGAHLSGVWSHLQEAEVDAITSDQVRRYEAALAALRGAGVPVPRRHLAASAAILVGAVPRYDAVRPGLITYGLVPDELLGEAAASARLVLGADRLRPVLSLRARPVRVADLPEGHGVSYGPTWRASRASRIATLPIGYGDGWPRSLSNRAEVLVRGVRAPVVGNVAMDATMVDVSDVPGPPVDLDDEFVLIGRQGDDVIPAAEPAQWRTTNSWEVVTALSARLTRVYDAPAGITGTRALSPQETVWLESNSGTATSATSRSTRS
jgi:alanine racemase